jgi:dTDP-4-amino-4,6-dideoxygalactose transaminase
VALFKYPQGEQYNYQYIVAEVDEQITSISRDDMVRVLHAENVLARRYFYPGCHQAEPYRSWFPDANSRLTRTNVLAGRVMSLPTGTAITVEEIEEVCEICRYVLTHGEHVRRALTSRFGD